MACRWSCRQQLVVATAVSCQLSHRRWSAAAASAGCTRNFLRRSTPPRPLFFKRARSSLCSSCASASAPGSISHSCSISAPHALSLTPLLLCALPSHLTAHHVVAGRLSSHSRCCTAVPRQRVSSYSVALDRRCPFSAAALLAGVVQREGGAATSRLRGGAHAVAVVNRTQNTHRLRE